MASIISTKRCDNYAILTLRLSLCEIAEFEGKIDNVHIIPEKACINSTVYERGRKGNTKYFLIPKLLRKDIKLKKEVECLRINSKEKIIWAYIMDKLK